MIGNVMYFSEGLEWALLKGDAPVVTDYGLYVLGRQLLEHKHTAAEPLKRLPDEWNSLQSQRTARRLAARRSIVPDADFRSGVWRVVQSTRSGSAEEIASIADPFCYVSHLSAMQRYGLTDRNPEALHLTTPERQHWNALRDQKVEKDLTGGADDGRRLLLRYGFGDTIRRRPVIMHETSHPAVPVQVRGEGTRITSIGQTFADMLSEPKFCGGMRHVIDVWERYMRDWSKDVIRAIDGLDSKIVKVRAGYIISDILGLEDDVVKSWEAYAQRGGSRKLDPDGAYTPAYSQRWMISINVG